MAEVLLRNSRTGAEYSVLIADSTTRRTIIITGVETSIELPTSGVITIKKGTTGATPISITAAVGWTFEDGLTYEIYLKNESLTFYCDEANLTYHAL